MRWLAVASLVVLVASAVASLALGAPGAAPAGRFGIADLGTLGFGNGEAVAGNERGSSNRRGSAEPDLRDIRVCAYEFFSKRLGRCTRDQRRQVIYSSQVVCSAALVDPYTRVRVAMGWRYAGGSIWSGSLVGRGKTVWTTFSLGGPFPLPGGEYRCRLAVGNTSKVSVVRSSGPTGEIVDTAICDYRRSHIHFGNRSCLEDDDGRSVTPGSGVVCNAAFVKVTGRQATISLLTADGQNAAPPYSFVVRTPLYWAYESSGRGRLPSGQYRCQFVLDGVVKGEKSLTIAAP